MKAYVMTTGAVFGLLTLAHIWRVIEEGPHLAKQPWWVLITVGGFSSPLPPPFSAFGLYDCFGARRGRDRSPYPSNLRCS